jgi:hypothetical protein
LTTPPPMNMRSGFGHLYVCDVYARRQHLNCWTDFFVLGVYNFIGLSRCSVNMNIPAPKIRSLSVPPPNNGHLLKTALMILSNCQQLM